MILKLYDNNFMPIGIIKFKNDDLLSKRTAFANLYLNDDSNSQIYTFIIESKMNLCEDEDFSCIFNDQLIKLYININHKVVTLSELKRIILYIKENDNIDDLIKRLK